ncbi:MAG: NEW3 domain-containing protein [Planctomycetota bacterium]|nr:NEW3 domain-containing protein [Planctomycetota bacterium]
MSAALRYPLIPLLALACVLTALPAACGGEPEHPAPARTKGWSWKTPPDMVKPDSGKRNHVFYAGEPVEFKLGKSATSYEVRDYTGELVDQGPAGESVTLKVKAPGWYKLYVYGKEVRKEWGDIVGTTNFVVFRNNPNFPPLPPPKTPGGGGTEDEVMRGVTGMGPQRHRAEAAKPTESFRELDASIEPDKKYYLPFDPVRKRALMIAFPNGTKGKLDGVKKVVERYKDVVKYWEPRNEPNFGSGGADFVKNEMKDFYDTVKAVDPSAKVMGPGMVSIGPQLQGFIHDFLRGGGAQYTDVFSFHIYNGVNGDVWLARQALGSLQEILARYGVEKIEKWQTEQGFMAAVYGSYQPRLQGRWTMLEFMLFEQYGIPKEHNHYWYDVSHGFWDCPMFWENEDGGLNPGAALIRVWSEELYGTNFAKALDFGKDGNKLYVGSLFAGEGKSVAAIMNVGCGVSELELRVKGGDKLHVVSPVGVESDVPVQGGIARVKVPELPVYVELAQGQTIEPAALDWGPNLARLPGVTAAASGTGEHPVKSSIPNSITKITNGEYENWYWQQRDGDHPWMDNTKEFPAWVEVRLPAPTQVARVVVFAPVPWQWDGTLVDYELQYDKGGQWVTLDHVKEPLKTFGVYSPPTRTSVDSFFADRWVFEHQFAPVTTAKIRLLVHETTWGGGATSIVPEAGGQTGPHQVMLREVEIYGPAPTVAVRAGVPSLCVTETFAKKPVTITVANKADAAAQVTARVAVPQGWEARPAELPVALGAKEAKTASFDLVPPAEIAAGPVPVQVALVDAQGKTADSDTLTLKVTAPVDLAPQMPATFDEKKQELTVVATGLSKKPIKSVLRLEVKELAAGAKAIRLENEVTLQPFEKTPVAFTVPDVNLGSSAWHVTYSIVAEALVATAAQDIAIRLWMVAGPFANDFAKDFGPEKGVDLAATYPALGGKTAGWKAVASNLDGYVDLVKAFQKEPHENCSAYAVVYVKCPTARKAVLSVGSDDGVKAWLNGKEVVADNASRGAAPGQDKADVELVAGWNELLLKITQGGGGWGLYADLLTPDGKPMDDLSFAPGKK